VSVLFAVTWSVALLCLSRSATSRILAVRVSLLSSLIAGGIGIATGWVAAQTFAKGISGPGPDRVFAFFSSLATLVVASAVRLVARSRQLTFGGASGADALHPLRALRARLGRIRRYAELG
jgi:hypothetical protein